MPALQERRPRKKRTVLSLPSHGLYKKSQAEYGKTLGMHQNDVSMQPNAGRKYWAQHSRDAQRPRVEAGNPGLLLRCNSSNVSRICTLRSGSAPQMPVQ